MVHFNKRLGEVRGFLGLPVDTNDLDSVIWIYHKNMYCIYVDIYSIYTYTHIHT